MNNLVLISIIPRLLQIQQIGPYKTLARISWHTEIETQESAHKNWQATIGTQR